MTRPTLHTSQNRTANRPPISHVGLRLRSSRLWHRRLVWLLVPWLLLISLRVLVALPVTAPLAVDELGYLGNARFLATGTGLVDPAGRAAYKLGYSLFLTPAFLSGQDPEEGFRFALLINALLLSTAYPALFVFLGQIRPGLGAGERALVATALNLHPAAVLYGTTAMSASLFIPLFCWFSVGLFDALNRGRAWIWAGVGAAAGLLYSVHERAVGILLLTLATTVAVLVLRRRRGVAGLVAIPSAALIVLGVSLLSPAGTTYTGAYRSQVLEEVLANAPAVLVELAGQGMYLVLSSLGLLLFAAIAALILGLRGQRLLEGSRLFWLVWIGCGLSVMAISVLFMALGGRENLTYLVYGRYNEGVLLPFLAVSVALLHRMATSGDNVPTIAWTAGTSVAVAGAAAMVLRATRGELLDHSVYFFNALASFPFVRVRDALPGLLPWALLAIVLVPGLLLATRWRTGAAALLLSFVLLTIIVHEGFWRHFTAARAQQHVLADIVRQLPTPPQRVVYDPATFPTFHYFNYSYHLPAVELVRSTPGRLSSPDVAELVISPRHDLGTLVPGSRLVAMENIPSIFGSYWQYLWVLPGDLQEELAKRNWLFPESFPETVLCRPPAFRLEITGGASEGSLARGRRGLVRVTNQTPCPWPNAAGLKSREGSVGLDLDWYREDGDEPAVSSWIDLPRVVMPGQTVNVSVPALPPGASPSLRSSLRFLAIRVGQNVSGEIRTGGGNDVRISLPD